MRHSYPKIIYPERISEILRGINIIEKSPLKPVEPIKPTEPKFNSTSLLLIGISIFFSFLGLSLIGVIAFGVFIIIATGYFINKNYYNNQNYDYIIKHGEYNSEMYSYREKLKKYEELIEKLNNKDFENKHKCELIKAFISDTLTFKFDYNSKKGVSEVHFESYLYKYFPKEIFKNKIIEQFKDTERTVSIRKFMDENEDFYDHELYEYGGTIELKKSYNPYCPDFIFKKSEYNLHIDIEIDEPYTESTPIHYIENSKEKLRDNYFSEKKWIVIRFAEEQIINQPESCCYIISQVINSLTNDNSYLLKFETILELEKVNCWTKSDALELIHNNYRSTYLSKIDNKNTI